MKVSEEEKKGMKEEGRRAFLEGYYESSQENCEESSDPDVSPEAFNEMKALVRSKYDNVFLARWEDYGWPGFVVRLKFEDKGKVFFATKNYLFADIGVPPRDFTVVFPSLLEKIVGELKKMATLGA